MRFQALSFCVAGALLAGAASAQPAPPLGAWTAIAAERNGAPAPDLVGHRLEVTEARFRITREGRVLYGGGISFDAAATPARVDFRLDEGPVAGQAWAGIWRLGEGALTICDNAPAPQGPRPTTFTAPAGSGVVCVTFRR